jgi:hypothetical protein
MDQSVSGEIEIKKGPGAVWPAFVYLGMLVPYWIIGHHKELSPRLYVPTLILAATWFLASVSIKFVDRWRRLRGGTADYPMFWIPWLPVVGALLKAAAIRMPDGSRPEFLLYTFSSLVLIGIASCSFLYWLYRFLRVAKRKRDSPEANRMADAVAGAVFLGIIMDP